jgi:hypothetical protein
MAKASRKRKDSSEAAKKTKKQIAMGRKETRQNRIILLCVGVLIAVIVTVLAVGVIQELIVKPSSPVATVNGVKIPTDDYQNLVTYNRYNYYSNIRGLEDGLEEMRASPEDNEFLIAFYEQQLGQIQTALTLAPQDAVEELIDAELARQKAEEEGIEVTEQEVDQAIEDDFRAALSPQPQEPITGTEQLPTPTPIAQEQVDDLYNSVLDAMQLTDDACSVRFRIHSPARCQSPGWSPMCS